MEIIISFILLGILFYIYRYFTRDVVYVTSSVDGKKYLVRDLPDKQEGADRLAKIKARCDKLVEHLKINASKYDERFALLVERYINKDTEFTEKDKETAMTSYTENKGDRIVFCIRQRNPSEQLVDLNTMMFVAIHEMGHIMSKSYGHNDEFWTNFADLLEVAIDIDLYKNEDYSTTPKEYCGMDITTNPLIKKQRKNK
jgi:hypothetical protein